MSTVNGISSVNTQSYDTYKDYSSVSAKASEAKGTDAAKKTEDTPAAVYEKSTKSAGTSKAIYTQDTDLVERLKADAAKQVESMRSLVEQLITGQGKSFAIASDDDIWKFFAEGVFSNVSDAAKAQAEKDIAEGGYWSVDETSKRIVEFAKGLTGGDPEKIDTMIDAFKEGYKQATKAWGKDLPDISKNTYDAVMKGFEEWRSGTATAAE